MVQLTAPARAPDRAPDHVAVDDVAHRTVTTLQLWKAGQPAQACKVTVVILEFVKARPERFALVPLNVNLIGYCLPFFGKGHDFRSTRGGSQEWIGPMELWGPDLCSE
jgi:hypothetical protein